MKRIGFVFAMSLVATLVVAQQGQGAQAAPRQGAGEQSTIQGCVMGSPTTSTYVLTDEHTGEIYLLHGNDPLLKEQVGHEVIMTGTATPIRPSDKKGSLGYISPSEPQRTATSDHAGQKALHFEVTHIQPIANTCAQQSESQKAAIAANQQQTAQANQPVTGPDYEQNRNSKQGTELPGASLHINGGQREREQQAEEHQQTHPTLIGCVVKSAKSDNEFFLTEQKSGTRYRLQASPQELKDHLNHLVEVVGKPASESASKAVAGQNEPAFEVSGIQDLAPTCGASH